MAECRSCLANNVRMHLISDTRYREMFEKLSGKKLAVEDGRPESICYICNAQLQRFWRFFETAQRTEKMLTTRLLFGIEMQGGLQASPYLCATAVKAVSYAEDGAGAEAAPEVTVTVKEELDDADEWEQFKDEFMDSPTADIENDETFLPEEIHSDQTKMADRDTEINNHENIQEKEFKTEILDNIKTETENTESLNESIDLQKLFTFPIKADIKFHPKLNRESYYYCKTCDYRCQHSKTLRKHNMYHDVRNQYICTFCLYRFPNEKKLASHRNYCTVCNICGKKFHNLNGLRIHVRLHTGEQPYSCDLCGRGFNQKTNLQTHLRVHAREKQFPCEICHKIFPFSTYLKRHMLIHSENHLDGESMHRIMNCHKLFNRKKKATSICTVCGKTLRKDSLSMHMRLHTGELPFTCERCHKCFNQKCNLLTHVERVHPGDILFACKVCFKTFAMNSELRKHLVTHGKKVEVKPELISQTEKTIEKFISEYEKHVEKRTEKRELTEIDKKMELIMNLGLKPRDVKPQESNGLTVKLNLNTEPGQDLKGVKRKCSTDFSVTDAKRKATIETDEDKQIPVGSLIKGDDFAQNPLKTKGNRRSAPIEKIISNIGNLVRNSKGMNVTNPGHLAITNTEKDKKKEPVTDAKNTDIVNNVVAQGIKVLNCKSVADCTYIHKEDSEKGGTHNLLEVELKRELISENEYLTETKVLESNPVHIDNTKLTDEKSSEDADTGEVIFKNEFSDGEQYNEMLNTEDVEYFDDSIEILEVELSDNIDQDETNQNVGCEDFAFDEDIVVDVINPDQDLTDDDEEQTMKFKKISGISEDHAGYILAISDNEEIADQNIEEQKRQSAYDGVEVSVVDPDDIDDSIIDSEELNIEEEYLDLSDSELYEKDRNLDPIEQSDEVITHDLPETPKKYNLNECKIKLRSDLFRSEENLNINEDCVGNDSVITTVDIVDDKKTNEENMDDMKTNVDMSSNITNLITEVNLDKIPAQEIIDDFDITDQYDIEGDANNAEGPISARDFEIFQQKHISLAHRQINKIQMLSTPYPCDMCRTRVFSC